MPNQSLKQLKQTIKKLQPTKKTDQQPKTTNEDQKNTKKGFKLPKLSFKKKVPQQELPTVAKALPKGTKIVDKYSLYEPFAQVAIVQEPKTGEYKYILDELQLDTFERGIYNRVLKNVPSRNRISKRRNR